METRQRLMWGMIADAIEAHPELYDQSQWGVERDCGTAACLAGWACALAGYRPTVRVPRYSKPYFSWDLVNPQPLKPWSHRESVEAGTAAEDLLGLNPDEAAQAFESGTEWTPEDLRRIASGDWHPREILAEKRDEVDDA